MAQQIYTIGQILEDLNTGLPTKPWVVTNELYSLPTAKIDPNALTIDPAGASIALKGFINQNTGELRVFVAKWLDEPETKVLP